MTRTAFKQLEAAEAEAAIRREIDEAQRHNAAHRHEAPHQHEDRVEEALPRAA